MILRKFELRDTEQIARLFHDTIRIVNLRDYTQEQIEAWAPADIHFRNWAKFCSSRCTMVAERSGQVVGYGQLERNGHIDHFYVHHQHQRQGVGNGISAAIEMEARNHGIQRLFTEASLTARPFFDRMGYELVREQTVICRGQAFINYVMEKLTE
jgi:putative acetyltransferase